MDGGSNRTANVHRSRRTSDKDIEDRVKEITARLNREFGQAFANDEDDDLPIDEDEDEEEDEDDGELDFG